MAQLVETTTISPDEVKSFINGLNNGYTDVLSITQATNGYVLIIYKPQS